MMLRHGNVIAEGWWQPYAPDLVHTMYSMSKSFTSTAVGFAVSEGLLSVQDKVISFFPDDLPPSVSENLASLRVQDLLTMSAGSGKEPTQMMVKTDNWVRTFLAHDITHRPGTEFMYNSAATYMCSAIVQKVTGKTILDYLSPRLFEPLGMSGMRWETCPAGINTGGWGLSIQTEGLAKFGQLLLQKGKWNSKQLIPAEWIEEATRLHILQPGGDKSDRPKSQNDWLQGYGYQFWRCQHGAFRGDGAFGQFTIVMPEQDAVVVMTGENKNMQGLLDLVWKDLLPSFDHVTADSDSSLKEGLKSLSLAPPISTADPSMTDSRNGKSLTFQPNELGWQAVRFTFNVDEVRIATTINGKTQDIHCGVGKWMLNQAKLPGSPPRLISGGGPKDVPISNLAASACWTNPETLQLTWRYRETPHHDTVTIRFGTEGADVSFMNSMTAMNPKATDSRPALKGKFN